MQPDTLLAMAVFAGAISLSACGGGTSPTPPPAGTAPPASTADGLESVSGIGQANAPPWPIPNDARARSAAAGLPMGPMGMAEHYHPQLNITVGGRPLEIPANIGVDPSSGQMSALHTHTPDGVIHIEASRAGEVFTLGQLFTEWNVKLGPGQLGSLGRDRRGTLALTVNDAPVSGNPALLRLAPDQRITLAFTGSAG